MRVSEHEWYAPYFQSDEEVLWQGRPDRHELGAVAEVAKGAPMLLMLGWGGFMLYLVISDGGVPAPILWGFGGIIAVWMLIAFYIGFGKALISLRRLRRTEYVITSRRILRRMGRVVDGLDRRSMPRPYLRKGAMHFGTITFGAGVDRDAYYTRHPSLALAASFELRAIPEAAKVLRILTQTEVSALPVKPLSDLPFIPLEEGERLLWQGHPEQGSFPLTFTMTVNNEKFPVGIWFTLLPAVLMAVFIWQRLPLDAWLAACPFWGAMVYGLYCLGLFSLRIHRQMNREEYAITDRRVLRRMKSSTSEYRPTREDVIFLAQGRDGCGTLVIGNVDEARRRAARSRNSLLSSALGFQLRAIADPTHAMDALHTLIPDRSEEEAC